MFNYTQEMYEEFYKSMQERGKMDLSEFERCMEMIRPVIDGDNFERNFKDLLEYTTSHIPAYFLVYVANYDKGLFKLATDKFNDQLHRLIKIEKKANRYADDITDEIKERRKILIDRVVNVYFGTKNYISNSDFHWILEEMYNLGVFEQYQRKVMDKFRVDRYLNWDTLPAEVITRDAVWFDSLFANIPNNNRNTKLLNNLYHSGKVDVVQHLLSLGYTGTGFICSLVKLNDWSTMSALVNRAYMEYIVESGNPTQHLYLVEMLDVLMYEIGHYGDVSIFNRLYNEMMEIGAGQDILKYGRAFKKLNDGIIDGDSLDLLKSCQKYGMIIDGERVMRRASLWGTHQMMDYLLTQYDVSIKCLINAAKNEDPFIFPRVLGALKVSAFVGNPNHSDKRRDLLYQKHMIIKTLCKIIRILSKGKLINSMDLITKNLVQYHAIDATTCTELPPFITK